MGLKLTLLHVASDQGGGKPWDTSAANDGLAVWDHTAVSLSYVNMLTLRCQDFDKWVLNPLSFASVLCMCHVAHAASDGRSGKSMLLVLRHGWIWLNKGVNACGEHEPRKLGPRLHSCIDDSDARQTGG